MNLYSEINHVENSISILNTRIKGYIKDRKFPLEERWGLFKKWPIEWGSQSKYIVDYSTFEWREWDHLYLRKEKIVDVATLLEFDPDEEQDGLYDDDTVYQDIQLNKDKYREDILETGYRSFIFDW